MPEEFSAETQARSYPINAWNVFQRNRVSPQKEQGKTVSEQLATVFVYVAFIDIEEFSAENFIVPSSFYVGGKSIQAIISWRQTISI